MDEQYLKDNVGPCLAECLAQVSLLKPRDPIEYIGGWLHNHVKTCKHAGRKHLLPTKDDNLDKTDVDDGETGSLEIEDIALDLRSESIQTKIRAARACRRIVSRESSPPIGDVIDAGIVPLLVDAMKYDEYKALLFEAGWALTNIASGTTTQTAAVVDAGAVPLFLKAMSSKHEDVADQCVWAVGNIIGDGPRLRDHCVSMGVIPVIHELIQKWTGRTDKKSFLRNAAWLLVNICRHKDHPLSESNSKLMLPDLRQLILQEDNEVVSDALWGLSYLSDFSRGIQWVLEADVIDQIVPLLGSEVEKIQTPALRVLGNIVTGTDRETQIVIDSGVISKFHALLTRETRSKIKKEVLWFISNITAGTKDQVQTVIDAQLLPLMVDAMLEGSADVQKEAAWAIANITTTHNADQMEAILDNNGISALCCQLEAADDAVRDVVLDAIVNLMESLEDKVELICKIIEEQDALVILERYQDNEDKQLSEKAEKIIDICMQNHTTSAIMTKLKDEDPVLKARGIRAVINLVSQEEEDKLEELQDEGVTACILECLTQKDSLILQQTAAKAFQHITEDCEALRDDCVQKGCIPVWITAIDNEDDVISGNMCTSLIALTDLENGAHCSAMLGHDVISILLARLVRFDVQDIDGECLLLLVNLVKALPSESADSAIDICLPTFVDVAVSKTPKEGAACLVALERVTKNPGKHHIFLEKHFLPYLPGVLTRLTNDESKEDAETAVFRVAAMKCLYNLWTNLSNQEFLVRQCLNEGILEALVLLSQLKSMLNFPEPRETFMKLVEITSKYISLDLFIASGLAEGTFKLMTQKTSEEEAMDVTIEIIQALLVKLSPEQISLLMDMDLAVFITEALVYWHKMSFHIQVDHTQRLLHLLKITYQILAISTHASFFWTCLNDKEGAVLVLTESKNNKEEFIASMAKDVWTLSEQQGVKYEKYSYKLSSQVCL